MRFQPRIFVPPSVGECLAAAEEFQTPPPPRHNMLPMKEPEWSGDEVCPKTERGPRAITDYKVPANRRYYRPVKRLRGEEYKPTPVYRVMDPEQLCGELSAANFEYMMLNDDEFERCRNGQQKKGAAKENPVSVTD